MDKPANLGIDRYQYAETVIRSLSHLSETQTLFDIGAGDARFHSMVSETWHYFGFDREGWGDVVQWDLINPCPNQMGQADLVLLLDVIEHLPNPGIALRNISLSMKHGGSLVLTTPNPRWSGARLNLLFKGELSSFGPSDLDENYHVLPVWPHVLEQFLKEAGLCVTSYVTLDGKTALFEAKGKLRGLPRYALNVVQMLIEARDASAKGMSYGIVAKKLPELAFSHHYPSHKSSELPNPASGAC